jgi:hypothetical protein
MHPNATAARPTKVRILNFIIPPVLAVSIAGEPAVSPAKDAMISAVALPCDVRPSELNHTESPTSGEPHLMQKAEVPTPVTAFPAVGELSPSATRERATIRVEP